MSWRVAGRNAVRMLRSLLALPLRATAWLFVGLVVVATAAMRLFGALADVMEGV